MSVTADTDIIELKGVGKKQQEYFHKLGVYNIKDLILHIPYRYEDTSTILPIIEFKAKEEGCILAEVVSIKTTYGRMPITKLSIQDDTDKLTLIFFNQKFLQKIFHKGEIYLFYLRTTQNGKNKNIYCQKYEKFKFGEKQDNFGKLLSIYPETKGLNSRAIRTKVEIVKNDIKKIFKDPIKLDGYLPLDEALTEIHFPQSHEDIQQARDRLAFDEMLPIGIKIEQENKKRMSEKAEPIPINTEIIENFKKTLPYEMTNDQNKAIQDTLEDCNSTIPMNRLLNGDVGSGKTIVSAIAILNCIANGYSAVLLAPTTVLARQHYETFKNLFAPFNIGVELCIRTAKNVSKMDNKLIVGTHAILFEKNLPKDLNLVVIDEQHKFGVNQRNLLKSKTTYPPHYLTMTATPIPRSLTEIFFGGLDVTEIKEKPKNRKEIKTYYVPLERRMECFEWIKDRIISSNHQEQAFFVYPLIEESDKRAVKSLKKEHAELKEFFSGLKIDYLHGKLDDDEKIRLLDDFKNKKIDILFSTTVIEVGIDIPDATIMVIEDAEVFGLSQLHQLRGRIGRGEKESFCYVIQGESVEDSSPTEDRLRYFASHTSGFEVAEFDLQKRGPGEVYGIKQSGVPQFKIADITDTKLLKNVRTFAKDLIEKDNDIPYILDNLFK